MPFRFESGNPISGYSESGMEVLLWWQNP